MKVLDEPKLRRDIGNRINEGGIALYQVQDSPDTNAINRILEYRPSDIRPIHSGIEGRVAPFRKGGCAAQSHRKEVGVEAKLMDELAGYGTAESRFKAGEDAFYDAIEADFLKCLRLRFHPDPAEIGRASCRERV